MGMGKWAPETKSAILRLLEEFVFGDISVFSGLAGRVFFFFFFFQFSHVSIVWLFDIHHNLKLSFTDMTNGLLAMAVATAVVRGRL